MVTMVPKGWICRNKTRELSFKRLTPTYSKTVSSVWSNLLVFPLIYCGKPVYLLGKVINGILVHDESLSIFPIKDVNKIGRISISNVSITQDRKKYPENKSPPQKLFIAQVKVYLV